MRATPLLVLACILAGCASTPGPSLPGSPDEAGTASPAFGNPVTLDAPASEPDIAVAPGGLVLICALVPSDGGGGQFAALVWSSQDGSTFNRMPHPASAAGGLDCSVSADAGGRAYFADLEGAAVVLASTTDGKTWKNVAATAAGPGVVDRPWLLGGAAEHALLVVQDTARGGNVAYSTSDAGTTWAGPDAANPTGVATYQTNGNLARGPGGILVFPFGVLGADGPAVDAMEVWAASSTDGRAWNYAPIAKARGNIQYVFPMMTGDDSTFYATWAEARAGDKGVQVYVATSTDAKTWSAPRAVNAANTSAVMPRVAATPKGPLIAYHVANATAGTTHEASYRFVAMWPEAEGWREQVLAPASHNGTFSMGGYGYVGAALLTQGTGTSNTATLLHTFGLTTAPDGRYWIAWADDPSAGHPRVHVAHT